jgi:hypothetical protein
MLRSLRVVVLAGASLIAILAAPATVSAAPDESSCAAFRFFAYAMPLPTEMRTIGIHRVEWLNTFVDVDGTPLEFFDENQIEIADDAPIYVGNALVRLSRNVGLLPSGDVDTDVRAIRPTQTATLYVGTFFFKDTPNIDTDRMFVRWEGDPGVWSPWIELGRSQVSASCSQSTTGLLHRSLGWIG